MSQMELAKELDKKFPSLKEDFEIPTFKSAGIKDSDEQLIYLCGNSLGLMPRAVRDAINKDLDAWQSLAVLGHGKRPDGSNGWMEAVEEANPILAELVGAKEDEVAFTGTLTSNLNQLLDTFYRPEGERVKLLFEDKAFPSDNYCFQNQARLKGQNPDEVLIRVEPRAGEAFLRNEDIVEIIEKQGHEVAVCIFSGIQYYTGQKFDIPAITAAARKAGCIVGWDLAHATGNVPLKLHDWGADFAVGCSYKYLNGGSGNMGFLFVNNRHFGDEELARPAGWWGVGLDTRFKMEWEFRPIRGARGFCQSCPNWAAAPCIVPSLKLFRKAGGIEQLQARSKSLTGLFDKMLRASSHFGKDFELLTPSDPDQRGSQLTLLFRPGIMPIVFDELVKAGIVGDERNPDAIRLAPTALYNTHVEVVRTVETLERILSNL
ncbi:Kynureninase [Wickerhamiella sorbophila]|uniref:Kynureninase n=1 Tax=Wickerhamiella sorbophila TaxID=45607 RepID=A0A2T0FBV7_9ASCO|nr:Kynureninase [Wickerhamiella sorbophila]PRT52494.1 Kynureninase [Wickerhamiella sorbophila]